MKLEFLPSTPLLLRTRDVLGVLPGTGVDEGRKAALTPVWWHKRSALKKQKEGHWRKLFLNSFVELLRLG